jgi:crossover junction endodeoxyribonuclease RuvC
MSPTLSELRLRPEGIIAIDPGQSGAVVHLQAGRLRAWRDFKERQDIARAIKFVLRTSGYPTAAVVIEAVHAMPGQGVVSMFNFGQAFGIAQGAVWTSCNLPVTFVSPQKWQNYYRAAFNVPKGEQFDSRTIAVHLFPEQMDLFRRKKDHNTADAALMALWGLATL